MSCPFILCSTRWDHGWNSWESVTLLMRIMRESRSDGCGYSGLHAQIRTDANVQRPLSPTVAFDDCCFSREEMISAKQWGQPRVYRHYREERQKVVWPHSTEIVSPMLSICSFLMNCSIGRVVPTLVAHGRYPARRSKRRIFLSILPMRLLTKVVSRYKSIRTLRERQACSIAGLQSLGWRVVWGDLRRNVEEWLGSRDETSLMRLTVNIGVCFFIHFVYFIFIFFGYCFFIFVLCIVFIFFYTAKHTDSL